MSARNVVVLVLSIVVLIVSLCSIVITVKPPFAAPVLEMLGLQQSEKVAYSGENHSDDVLFGGVGDPTLTEAELEEQRLEKLRKSQTPLIAQVEGVDIHCPIQTADLTGVLFHQASYDYALVMETKMPEADPTKALNERNTRINREQVEGEWLDADALHIWRTSDTTPMDTSIDVGAAAGTIVRSPISGTVVLVQDYKLYDEVPDIRIHIQPDGKPDLDCVLLHTADPLVKAGDHVEAGVTEISHIRDIQKDLIDVQLFFYMPEGVGGNHTHVQMNNANAKGYREERLKGALKVKE